MFLALFSNCLKDEVLEGRFRENSFITSASFSTCKSSDFAIGEKKMDLPEFAEKIFNDLKYDFNVISEEKDSIGKRYRRQDAIGTPFCITVDHDSLTDGTVTLRERDTMKQERVKVEDLRRIIDEKVNFRTLLSKI